MDVGLEYLLRMHIKSMEKVAEKTCTLSTHRQTSAMQFRRRQLS